ncbi:MAG: NnrS family protein [Planctomycetes bacterium]|nr:NnrS family protein [Planctomycetota bacterium]
MTNPHGLRREPWRLLFPIGLLALIAGAAHWLAFALGWSHDGGSVFHGIAQVQGFVLAFASGVVLTMLPRRTGTAPPSPGLLGLAVLGTAGTVLAVRFGAVKEGETLFVLLVLAMLRFVVRALRSGPRRGPQELGWLALAFAIALCGAVFTGLGAALGREFFAWHEFGKLCVTQGAVLALMLGAGSVVIPMATRGELAPDASGPRRVLTPAMGLAAIALVASFALEAFVAYRAGHLLRGLLMLGLLARPLALVRPITRPGLEARVLRTALACVPLGHLVAALSPWPRLGLHLAYVGGVLPLVLAVGLHVARAHAPWRLRVPGERSAAMVCYLACALALALRTAAELEPLHRTRWLGGAAAAMFTAACASAWLVLPRCWRSRTRDAILSANPDGPRDRG